MLIDGRSVGAGDRLEAELCVIGAGPAGITVAHALRNRPFRVLLVEAGGFEYDGEVQELYRAETGDLPYELMDMRVRYFGGSSNHWGGYCRPMEPATFAPRPWVPHSGWPIRSADLAPYYPPAAALCGLPGIELDPEVWARRLGHGRIDFEHAGRLRNAVFQIAPYTRFGERYRDDLLQAANVTIALNSSVLRLHSNPEASAVTHAEVATLAGNRFTIAARAFVLACGGVENPRILLASNAVEPAGLGNRRDLVGRFFMDHGHFNLGQLEIAPAFDPVLYMERPPDEEHGGLQVHITLSEAAQREAGVADQSVQFHPWVSTPSEHSFNVVKEAIKHGRYPERLGEHLANIIRDFGPVTQAVSRRFQANGGGEGAAAGPIGLRFVGEQVPNPDSRITLAEQRDRFDVPIARVAWRLAELDWHTMRATGRIVADEFGRLGLGRVQLDPAEQPAFVDGGWHHMGTTRMSDDPATGVVDRHCRVHGIDNLFIGGSSVFATGGHGTPTLTIVALALRLADHLQGQVLT
jgi:choline dehydrogenase-like flavoprotein